VAGDDLTRTLLLEEVCTPRAIADALFASINGQIPLLQALVDSGATSADVLARYLGRTGGPSLKHVMPDAELVERLPADLCARLLAIPVGQDASTGVIDVAVADPTDPHPANEIAFHLGAPTRSVRANLTALEEALRRLRMRRGDGSQRRRPTLKPPEPELARPRRAGLVIEDSDPPPPPPKTPRSNPNRIPTPPYGTPVQATSAPAPSAPTSLQRESDVPIPLTRKTSYPRISSSSAKQATSKPTTPALGEGYAFDTTGLRDVVEKRASQADTSAPHHRRSLGSVIPGPPLVPDARNMRVPGEKPRGQGRPPAEMRGVLSALRHAGSRDEILELVLTGARLVAVRVALFVVKKGGYVGWVGSPEFADRMSLQSVVIQFDVNSVFDRAVREDLYLGLVPRDHVHASLLRAMRHANSDLAAVPIRVSGKTAVIIVATELDGGVVAARQLEEIARAAGDAFARLVRTRR
jgi:hypothetical protein